MLGLFLYSRVRKIKCGFTGIRSLKSYPFVQLFVHVMCLRIPENVSRISSGMSLFFYILYQLFSYIMSLCRRVFIVKKGQFMDGGALITTIMKIKCHGPESRTNIHLCQDVTDVLQTDLWCFSLGASVWFCCTLVSFYLCSLFTNRKYTPVAIDKSLFLDCRWADLTKIRNCLRHREAEIRDKQECL